MRLWHIDLIPYLPKSQLLAQWRELNSIFKKQDKHILINYIYDYDDEYLFDYACMVLKEFRNKPFSKNYKIKRLIGVVEYYDRKLNDGKQIYESGYRVRFINDNEKSFYNCGAWSDFYDCEVIGNIHDNPELLEEDK